MHSRVITHPAQMPGRCPTASSLDGVLFGLWKTEMAAGSAAAAAAAVFINSGRRTNLSLVSWSKPLKAKKCFYIAPEHVTAVLGDNILSFRRPPCALRSTVQMQLELQAFRMLCAPAALRKLVRVSRGAPLHTLTAMLPLRLATTAARRAPGQLAPAASVARASWSARPGQGLLSQANRRAWQAPPFCPSTARLFASGTAAGAEEPEPDAEPAAAAKPTETLTGAESSFEFQAEVAELLNIVANSLYTDKEVFVRELVSNASDALNKLRQAQMSGSADISLPLEIRVDVDEEVRSTPLALLVVLAVAVLLLMLLLVCLLLLLMLLLVYGCGYGCGCSHGWCSCSCVATTIAAARRHIGYSQVHSII